MSAFLILDVELPEDSRPEDDSSNKFHSKCNARLRLLQVRSDCLVVSHGDWPVITVVIVPMRRKENIVIINLTHYFPTVLDRRSPVDIGNTNEVTIGNRQAHHYEVTPGKYVVRLRWN